MIKHRPVTLTFEEGEDPMQWSPTMHSVYSDCPSEASTALCDDRDANTRTKLEKPNATDSTLEKASTQGNLEHFMNVYASSLCGFCASSRRYGGHPGSGNE